MLSIPQYLLESSFCLAIFYGFYHLFLKKETFFQLNRAYLLATPIAALSIPLLNISFQKDAPPESLEAFFYPAIQSANNLNQVVWEQMRAPSPVFSLSVADVILAIYLIGIFLMSFSLLKGLWNLGRLIRRGKRSKNNEFTLVETQNNFPAASFFGYIFWNQQITDEQKLILEHEKVHIRQWHSLDVLLMEICVILKWFNPLIYWFRNALKVTHEFIADQYVIEQKSNVSEYATLLVNQHKQQIATPLTNTFYSLTKKRLQMMIQRPSEKIYATKYLLVFPLIIGMMGLFSFNLLEAIPQVGEGLAEMNSVLGDIGDKTVFEIDKPFLTEASAVLGQTEKRTSEYEIQLGNFKYNAGNATKFNSLDHKNDLTLREIQTLLDDAILFTKEGERLDLYKIDLVIPNPNVKYRTTNSSTKVGTEGEEEAFVIEATKTEDFKFTKPAINSFLKNIHDGSIFYINGYSKSEVFIGEFLVDYAEGEVSNKEMDRYFYFPENPNNNKLKIGQQEISMRGLQTGGTAAPAKINKHLFFQSLREGNLIFMQNGQPLVLDELYLTHAAGQNNYTVNIVKNEDGQFEIVTSFDSPPFKIKAKTTEGILFSETDIQVLEDKMEIFDLIELRGKNKEDSFLKTVFFTDLTLRPKQNHIFESTPENPIFDTPSLINNQKLKFKWGNIEFPIWHRDNPYFKNKSGTHVSVEKLIENLTAEMKVLDGKKVFDVHSMSLDFVFYNNKEKDDPAYIFTPPFKLLFKQGDKMKLFPTNQETLTKYINNFGKIYIKIPELGDFNTIIIDVGEERSNRNNSRTDTHLYSYQVIMPKYKKTGKTVLKIDTSMAKNKRIVDMYRNPDKYHTIHIPNFETQENLLWKDTDQIIKNDLNDWPGHSIISPLKSQYNGHIGDYSFSVGNAAAFDNKTYKHRISDLRLAELLSQSIRFTKNGEILEMDGVEIVIPYPGAVYDFDHTPYTEEAFIDNGSDDGKPFRMATSRAKEFQFSAEDLAEFKKIIQQGTKVYLNGYVEKEILTSHFHVLDAKDFEQAKNNLSELGAEMRQESPYKLQLGNTVIGLRATNSARMSGMNFLTANELIQGLQKNNLQFLNGGKIMNMEKVELVGTNSDNEYGWGWSRADDGKWQLSEDYAKKPIKVRANTSNNNRFSEGDIAKLIAVLPDLTGLHFYGRIEDTLYSANVFIHHEKKKEQISKYQLKWGDYTFNCREKNVENRKICNCEGLYINKADLAKMNTIGIQFLKNEAPVEFENVFVNVNGHVYCEKEDLMMSSDLQLTYNPDACIWNAFDEGDGGSAGFQTEDFDNVYFTFAINSENGRNRMEAPTLTIGKETFSLPQFVGNPEERPAFTFEKINKMVGERVRFTHLGETAEINDIKIQVANDRLRHTFLSLKEKELEKLKDFYPSDKVFYLDFHQVADNTFNLYFSLHPSDNIFKKHADEFTWGDYSFSFKNPFLAVTKKELTKLIQEQDLKNYLGTPIEKVTGVKFLYAAETVRYFGKDSAYDFKTMFKEQAFKENYDRLNGGDLINIMNLHSAFVKGGLTIFIKEETAHATTYFDMQLAKGGEQNKFIHPFIMLYRNHSIATVVADLLDIHPSKLKFKDKENLPKIHLTYKPLAGVDAKSDLLEKIKAQYPFVIKKKILNQEAWFLSEGDAAKLRDFEAQQIPISNLAAFKQKNFTKGFETLGPVKFDWFATTYFKRNYQIDVINLTRFSGKYILPLDTVSFVDLQAQLLRDFGLILKKEKRSLDIKEVVFE